MKAYVECPKNMSHAMYRVVHALKRHAPSKIEFVGDPDQADFRLLHVIGMTDLPQLIEDLDRKRIKFGMIQYCLRSTERPDTQDWIPLWESADIVWSYYHLPTMIEDDGRHTSSFNFYHAPLGVDKSLFFPTGSPKIFTMFTSGYVPEVEGVPEAILAAHRTGGKIIHLGPKIDGSDQWVRCVLGIDDPTLAEYYRQSQWVAGLRRCEGFELPAAEGLLCGARPICFDRPHYRAWYDEWAEFIPECAPEKVAKDLEAIFRQGPRPITPYEYREAARRFHWPTIIGQFWERLFL